MWVNTKRHLRHRSCGVVSLQRRHWNSSQEDPPCSCGGAEEERREHQHTSSRVWDPLALVLPLWTPGALQSPGRQPAPLVTQSWPLADPRPWHAVSSQAVPPCGDWEQLKLYVQPRTGICQYCSLCWRTLDLDLTITDACPFSPRETITHTLFMEKHLEVGLHASCLFSVLRDFLGNDPYCRHT